MATAPPPSMLTKLAQVYLKREQDRVGITAQQQAAQQQQLGDLVKQAQLRKLLQEMDLAPAEQESQIELRSAQAESARALGASRGVVKPVKAVERTVDLGNQIEYIYTDGTRELKPKGAPPKAPGGAGDDGSFAANPFSVSDNQGNTRLAVRVKGGGYQFVDNIGGTPVAPGPTAEQRNVEYQAQAVAPALSLVEQSLNEFAQSIEGGLPGGPSAMIPGTNAYYAKTKFQEQAKALLGAIVARQAGEGSRLSDEDRKSYSAAATIVNNVITLPGGVDAARARLAEAKTLLDSIMTRRKMGSGAAVPPGATPTPAPTPTPTPAPGATAPVRRIRFDSQGNVVR